MNDTTKTYPCKQCRKPVKCGAQMCPHCHSELKCEKCFEPIKCGAPVCPHCHSEQYPSSKKLVRKKWKRGAKWTIAYLAAPSIGICLIVLGGWKFACGEKSNLDNWLTLIRHLFFALVCLHFFTFHVVYDEDEKKGGDDGGGGGGGGE